MARVKSERDQSVSENECDVNSQPCPGPPPSPPPSPPPPGCPFTPGDVDGDGMASVLDLVVTTNSILGLAELAEGAFCAADVNGSGIVNILVSAIHTENEKGREREREREKVVAVH